MCVCWGGGVRGGLMDETLAHLRAVLNGTGQAALSNHSRGETSWNWSLQVTGKHLCSVEVKQRRGTFISWPPSARKPPFILVHIWLWKYRRNGWKPLRVSGRIVNTRCSSKPRRRLMQDKDQKICITAVQPYRLFLTRSDVSSKSNHPIS